MGLEAFQEESKQILEIKREESNVKKHGSSIQDLASIFYFGR